MRRRKTNRKKTLENIGGKSRGYFFPHFDSFTGAPTRENYSRHKKRLLSRLIKQIVCDRFRRLGIFGFLSHILKITLDITSPRKSKIYR